VKNFSSRRRKCVQVTITLPARCRRGEVQEKIMSRVAPFLLRSILNTVFGLPGIMLFGLAGGIALGVVVGRSTKHEIVFAQTPTSASPDAAAWMRSKAADERTRLEPAAPAPTIDFVAGPPQSNEVLAYTAGIGDTPPIARAGRPVRRK
jgi:hypothetical protein